MPKHSLIILNNKTHKRKPSHKVSGIGTPVYAFRKRNWSSISQYGLENIAMRSSVAIARYCSPARFHKSLRFLKKITS